MRKFRVVEMKNASYIIQEKHWFLSVPYWMNLDPPNDKIFLSEKGACEAIKRIRKAEEERVNQKTIDRILKC